MTDHAAAIREAWDFADPTGSEARFAAMLAGAEAARDQTFAMLIRTQIARALGLQRRFEDAFTTLDEVAAWVNMNTDDAHRILVHLLLERGRLFNSSGEATKALPYFLEALRFSTAASGRLRLDGLAVDAAHMCAIADPANADDWNHRALDLAESSSDPDARRWQASLLNNMGWTRFKAGDHIDALELFERALAARVEQGTDGKHRGPWLIARWCVAKANRVLGQVDEALLEQQQLAAEHAASGTSDGFVREEIGECLLALGRSAEAAPHFAAAYEALSRDAWLCEREPARLARLKALAG